MVFSLVWLAGVVALCYRKELNNLLSGGAKRKPEPLAHAWEEDFEPLGKPGLPDGVSILEQDAFSFAPAEEEMPPDDALLQGDVFDLMENVKPILEVRGIEKELLIGLVNEQVRDFPRLMRSPLLDSVYGDICERVNGSDELEFELSAEELKENL